MKLLYVVNGIRAGGAESVICHLACAVKQLGAEVSLFSLTGVQGERGNYLLQKLIEAGVAAHGMEPRRARSLANILAYIKLCRALRPDIIQATLYASELYACLGKLFASDRKTRHIRSIQSSRITRGTAIEKNIAGMVFDATVLCYSKAGEGRDALDAADRHKTFVVRNAIPMSRRLVDADQRRTAREALGISLEAFVYAHVAGYYTGTGLHDEAKAHDILFQALERLRKQEQVLLCCVGDGTWRRDAEKLAVDLGIQDSLRFIYEVNDSTQIYQAADVAVLPSRYEGLSMVSLEASALGLPFIATNIAEFSSVCPEGLWTLVPVNDPDALAAAMLEVKHNIARQTAKARAHAPYFWENYSIEACARQYMDVYEEILACIK